MLFRSVYWAGAEIGRMFVKLFPGVSKMLGGLKDLFNPDRFRGLTDQLKKVFENFFKLVRTDPKAGVEGFIKNFRILPDPKQPVIRIFLRSDPDTGYAIKGMKRVIRPGRRVYVGKDKIPTVKNGFGIAILSTSRGVMTGEKARKLDRKRHV